MQERSCDSWRVAKNEEISELSSLAFLVLVLTTIIYVNENVFLRRRIVTGSDSDESNSSRQTSVHASVDTGGIQVKAAKKAPEVFIGLEEIDSGVTPKESMGRNRNTNTKQLPYDFSASIKRPNSISKETQMIVHKHLKDMKTFYELPALLEKLKFKTGAELGVLVGDGAKAALDGWPSAEKYILVDLWAHQKNYVDSNNGSDEEHNGNYQQAVEKLKDYKDKTVFLRMLTTEAAKLIPDQSLDYIYIDARHDYCGVLEDIKAWYPKLKLGGIMGGHDYLTNPELKALDPTANQDWGLCEDGRRNEGAVKKAINDFAAKHALVVYSTTMDAGYETWVFGIKLREPTQL